MAHLTMCAYCGKSVSDNPWHFECRAEVLEDFLAQIKNELIEDDVLLHRVPQAILRITKEHFRTMDEIRKARVKAMEKEGRKKLKEIAKQEFLQKCAKEWDEKHPEDEDNDTFDPKVLLDETKKDAR